MILAVAKAAAVGLWYMHLLFERGWLKFIAVTPALAAAYAALAGLPLHVFCPRDTPAPILEEMASNVRVDLLAEMRHEIAPGRSVAPRPDVLARLVARAEEADLSRASKTRVAQETIVAGTGDVMFPIMATTLTTIVAFLSFIFMTAPVKRKVWSTIMVRFFFSAILINSSASAQNWGSFRRRSPPQR